MQFRFKCIIVTTLQAATWAGTARRISRRKNSAERQCVQRYALGQGCKDLKLLRPVRRVSVPRPVSVNRDSQGHREGSLCNASP